MLNDRRLALLSLLVLVAVGVGRADAFAQAMTPEDLVRADAFRGSWLMYGRTYNNQRFSPLAQITRANVKDLRPVWGASLGTTDGQEATPLVHGGRGLVFTGDAYGYFRAFDERTGAPLWKFQTGSAINAPAITYEIDGTQYVAVLSGMGGDLAYYLAGQKSGMLSAFALRNLAVMEDESGNFPQPNDNLKRKP